MNVLHLSISPNFDPVDFIQIYSTLKLFASDFNYDRKYLIKFMGYESDPGSFEIAWLFSSQR